MIESKLTLTECELVLDNSSIPPTIDAFQDKQKDIYELEGVAYDINCEVIDKKFFWIYIEYGKAKPYANKVFNVEKKEYAQNMRNPNEAELRNQIFCIYMPEKAVLYMSDFRKSKFLASYFKDRFKRNFSIRKYVINSQTFVNEINSVKSLRLVSVDRNLFNGGIFDNVRDVCGYDADNDGSIVKFDIEIQLKETKFNASKWLDFFTLFQNKKDRLEIDKMICVGESDEKIEKIFNLDTILKKIQIPALKNENEMYNQEEIKQTILRQLNA